MNLLPFKVVLLIAVATSQIFGGISCCCLGRSIFGNLLTMDSAKANQFAMPGGLASVTQKRQIGKCAKCSVGKRSPAIAVHISSNQRQDRRARVCEGGKCRCCRLVISANTPLDPPTTDCHAPNWVDPILGVKPGREVLNRNSEKYEVPVRFGGRNWQSIACLWKN